MKDVQDGIVAARNGSPPTWYVALDEWLESELATEDLGYLGELDFRIYDAPTLAADPAIQRLFDSVSLFMEANGFDPLQSVDDVTIQGGTEEGETLVAWAATVVAVLGVAGGVYICASKPVPCLGALVVGALLVHKVSAAQVQSATAKAPKQFASPTTANQWGVCVYSSQGANCNNMGAGGASSSSSSGQSTSSNSTATVSNSAVSSVAVTTGGN